MQCDSPQASKLSGMTVNERLFEVGLVKEFDAAARSRDLGGMVAILRRVELAEADALASAQAILASPARYGY
jgi:hypothetical protein